MRILLLIILTTMPLQASVTLLYFNDAHDMAPVRDRHGDRGGVARLKTVVDSVRAQQPNTLLIFGGDLAGGTLFGGVFRGMPLVRAFHQIPVDVATFGQHDFDFGADHTRTLVDSSQFTWFTTNLVGPEGEPFYHLPPVVIRNIAGRRIGLVGLTDAMATTTADSAVRQQPLAEAVNNVIQNLADKTDAVIVCSQTDPQTNAELLQRFPHIDAVFSEERSESQSRIFYIGERPVISPQGNMGSVARLDLEWQKNRLQRCLSVLPLDSTIVPNPRLSTLEAEYHERLNRQLVDTVGVLAVDLHSGFGDKAYCRMRECPAGNFVADAYRWVFDADIGFMHGGGIRADLKAGPLTRKDIWALLPFANSVRCVELSGEQIWSMLEFGVRHLEAGSNALLQISGGRYTINLQKQPGKRIQNVWINDQPIVNEKIYRVTMPDYLLRGGDGFEIVPLNGCPEPPILDVEAVSRYCRNRGLLSPRPQGRIVIQSP